MSVQPVAVGLNSYFGCAEESTYGTGLTPDRFYPIESEGVELKKQSINSKSMIPGKFAQLLDRRVVTKTWGEGDLNMEVTTSGMGRMFKHALGNVTVTRQGSTAAYLQTFTVGTVLGKGLSSQKVLRDPASNVVKTLTLYGTKVNTIEFKNSVGDMLECALNLIGRQMLDSVSPATPSYSANGLFSFQQGALTLGGSTLGTVKNFDVKLDNKLKTDRDYIGSGGLMAEPVDNADFKEVSGGLGVDFVSGDAVYAAYRDDTDLALVITYTGPVIVTTPSVINSYFKITVPNLKLDGDTPKIGGPDEISLDAKFSAGVLSGTGDALMQIDYMSLDVTP